MLRYLVLLTVLAACSPTPPAAVADTADESLAYYDNTGRDDLLSGGVKMIPITTPSGEYRVWTKRVGNNPP